MINQEIENAKNYLYRFNQILNQMADKMLSTKVVNNITIYFIRCMIPHHQAAIYMCENLLKYTNYPKLEELAKGIIKMQSNGIRQMKEIEKTTEGFESMPTEVYNYAIEYRSITENMIKRMKNSPRFIDINLNFIGEMIPHHEGAIAMCRNLLKYRIDPRLKIVAENIIKEQSEGVKELQEIRKKLC